MFLRNALFTSESVSEGHPDKLADRISDAIVDAFLELDPDARVACETLLADQYVVVAGEFKARSRSLFAQVRDRAEGIVRSVIRESGYTSSETGIDPDRCEVSIRFNDQSRDISIGVDRPDGVLGAGDQGMMFGYACDETSELMPAPIIYAHRLVRRQAQLRRSGELPWLQPDAKSQVSFRYENGRPVAIERSGATNGASPPLTRPWSGDRGFRQLDRCGRSQCNPDGVHLTAFRTPSREVAAAPNEPLAHPQCTRFCLTPS